MEGKGGELHMVGLHPSTKVKGEDHITPVQCVKVKVNRLHCSLKHSCSAALYNHRKWEWDSKTSRWRQL